MEARVIGRARGEQARVVSGRVWEVNAALGAETTEMRRDEVFEGSHRTRARRVARAWGRGRVEVRVVRIINRVVTESEQNNTRTLVVLPGRHARAAPSSSGLSSLPTIPRAFPADMHDGIHELGVRGLAVGPRLPTTVIINASSASAMDLSPTSLALSTG